MLEMDEAQQRKNSDFINSEAFYRFNREMERAVEALNVVETRRTIEGLRDVLKNYPGYMDAEDVKDSDIDGKRWNIAGGYDYSLSKRTSVYAAAAYTKDDLGDRKPSATEVIAGLIHKF